MLIPDREGKATVQLMAPLSGSTELADSGCQTTSCRLPPHPQSKVSYSQAPSRSRPAPKFPAIRFIKATNGCLLATSQGKQICCPQRVIDPKNPKAEFSH